MSDDMNNDKSAGLLSGIKDVVSNFTETVKEAASNVAESVKETASNVAENIKDYVTIAPAQVADDQSKEGQEFLDQTNKDTVSNAGQVFDSSKITDEPIKQDLSKPLDDLADKSGSLKQSIGQKINESIEKAKDFIQDTKESIVEKGHQLGDKISNQNVTQATLDKSKELFGKVKDVASDAKQGVLNAGQSISNTTSNFTDKAKDYITAGKDKVAETFTGTTEENLTPAFDPNADYAKDTKQKMAELGQPITEPTKDFDQLLKEYTAQNQTNP